MKLKILDSNGFKGIIAGDVRGVEIGVFLVDNDNRNWLVAFWKVRIIALNADRLTIQFSDHVCYDFAKGSIEEE